MKNSKQVIDQVVKDHKLIGDFQVTFEQPFGSINDIRAKNQHGDKIRVMWDENAGDYYHAQLSRDLTCLKKPLTSPNFWDQAITDEIKNVNRVANRKTFSEGFDRANQKFNNVPVIIVKNPNT